MAARRTASAPRTPSRPKTIDRLTLGVYHSIALMAGADLDVFTPLKDGPRSAQDIASAIGVRPERLRPLLFALVSAGLLTLAADEFGNTREAQRFLVKGSPSDMGGEHEFWSDVWASAFRTSQSIRSGRPEARHDFAAMSRPQLEAFLRGLHTAALAGGRELAERFDFSAIRTIVDVGGGSGGIVIALTERLSGLKATVAELPSVAPITSQFVKEARAEDRVTVATADAVRGPIPGKYDAAIAAALVQVLSPADARKALTNIAAAVKPGGRLFVRGRILDDSRLSPPESVAFNLTFINVYDHGQAYTESEYRAWMSAAGFEDIERFPYPQGRSIMTARKPAQVSSRK